MFDVKWSTLRGEKLMDAFMASIDLSNIRSLIPEEVKSYDDYRTFLDTVGRLRSRYPRSAKPTRPNNGQIPPGPEMA